MSKNALREVKNLIRKAFMKWMIEGNNWLIVGVAAGALAASSGG